MNFSKQMVCVWLCVWGGIKKNGGGGRIECKPTGGDRKENYSVLLNICSENKGRQRKEARESSV